jgi:simple sugar transport system substrate-binding protein
MELNEFGIGTTTVIIAIVITGIVAGTAGYFAAPPEVVEVEVPVEVPVEVEVPPKVKAGFIYVGPIGDVGWTAAHDRGRLIVDDKYDWLETVYAEGVAVGDAPDVIDTMFEAGADVVFTTSFGYGWKTVEAGERWPDKILYHCSGDPAIHGTAPNVGFYFADFYQIYYLNGMMAGALTKTNKIGYVAAFEIAELVRHINAFYLGAKEINPDVEMKVIVMGTAWYDPETAKAAFETLVEWGADVVAHTEDSPATISAAQSHYEETGEKVLVFSHYTPMKEFGPDVVISGQLVRWEKWYEHLILMTQQGIVENWQHWGLLHGDFVTMGSDWGEPVNPIFINELEAVTVEDPVLGTISVYDLIMHRYEQFKDMRVTFEVFKGPIYDSDGVLRVEPGEVIDFHYLNFEINWYVEGIIPPE